MIGEDEDPEWTNNFLKEYLVDTNIPQSGVELGSVTSFDQADTYENQGVSEDDFGWVHQLSKNKILDDFSRVN